MYFILKATLRTLLLPPASPLLLVVCGYWLALRFRRAGQLIAVMGWLSLWLLSTAVVADALSKSIERYPALDLAQAIDAQAIVIIGGGGTRELAPEYAAPAADFLLLDRLNSAPFWRAALVCPCSYRVLRWKLWSCKLHCNAILESRSGGWRIARGILIKTRVFHSRY